MPDIICSQFPEAAALMETAGSGKVIEMFSSQIDPHIWGAVIFALVGFLLVIGIEATTVMVKKAGK